MELLNQQQTKTEENLAGVIKSNLVAYETGANIERIRNRVENKIDTPVQYFECPPLRNLTFKEREDMLKTTFRMGNQMFFNSLRENLTPNFSHEYSLRYIEVTDEMISEIEEFKGNGVFSESISNL